MSEIETRSLVGWGSEASELVNEANIPVDCSCCYHVFVVGDEEILVGNSCCWHVVVVVAATPVERILLETDAPYLTPVPYRGKPNAPFYLPFVAEAVAAVKGMEIETLLAQAYRNSVELFFSDTA